MVDVSRILGAPDISTLRTAVANAFDELSTEITNAQKIADHEARLKVLEEKP